MQNIKYKLVVIFPVLVVLGSSISCTKSSPESQSETTTTSVVTPAPVNSSGDDRIDTMPGTIGSMPDIIQVQPSPIMTDDMKCYKENGIWENKACKSRAQIVCESNPDATVWDASKNACNNKVPNEQSSGVKANVLIVVNQPKAETPEQKALAELTTAKLKCIDEKGMWSEGICKPLEQMICENTAGKVWNLTAKTCDIKIDIEADKAKCLSQSGNWNTSTNKCEIPTPKSTQTTPPTATPVDLIAKCAQNKGIWNGVTCISVEQNECEQRSETSIWVNNECTDERRFLH